MAKKKNMLTLQSKAGQLAFLTAIRDFWRAGRSTVTITNILLENSDFLVGVKEPQRTVRRGLRIVKQAAARENVETTEMARKARIEYIEQQRLIHMRAVMDHDWPSAIRASTNIARARGAKVDTDGGRVLEDVIMPRDVLRALDRALCRSEAGALRAERFLGSQEQIREARLIPVSTGGNGDSAEQDDG